MKTGKKEDAFDIYFCYLEMFVGDYYNIRRMIELLSEYEANAIKELLKKSTLSLREIASRYHTSKTNISQINCGRNFKRDKDNYPIRKERVRANQFG